VPSDPHHLTFTQPRALGRRVSDEFIVPVCRVHHREIHRSGNEAAWWRKLNIDPIPIALGLWAQTRTDGDALSGVDQGVNHVAAHTASTACDQDHHAVRPLKATSVAGSDAVEAESLDALSAVLHRGRDRARQD